MKTFELPVSDTGNFIVGVLTDETISQLRGGGSLPEHGIIVWYRDKETAKAAFQAAVNAHWGDE